MTDFAAARENMVESQVRPNGVTDRRILDAMAAVAREDFVPEQRRAIAYMDEDVDLGGGRTLMEAMAFGRLLQLAEITPADKVLMVGDGMGYGAAVVAHLAGAVVSLEQDTGLAAAARQRLAGLANVIAAEGKLTDGCRAHGPYDVVVMEGRVGEVPEALFSQLSPAGRVVAVVGDGDVAKSKVLTVSGKTVSEKTGFDASVSPLPGFARKRPAFVF